MPERQALIEAAAKLQAATEELTKQFERVDAFAHATAAAHKKTRALTNWLFVGLVTLALVVAVLWRVNTKADDANDKATRSAEYDYANCLAANETRAADKRFWQEDILALIAPPDGSPGQKAFAAKLAPKVEKRYAPRDCSKVTEGRVR